MKDLLRAQCLPTSVQSLQAGFLEEFARRASFLKESAIIVVVVVKMLLRLHPGTFVLPVCCVAKKTSPGFDFVCLSEVCNHLSLEAGAIVFDTAGMLDFQKLLKM